MNRHYYSHSHGRSSPSWHTSPSRDYSFIRVPNLRNVIFQVICDQENMQWRYSHGQQYIGSFPYSFSGATNDYPHTRTLQRRYQRKVQQSLDGNANLRDEVESFATNAIAYVQKMLNMDEEVIRFYRQHKPWISDSGEDDLIIAIPYADIQYDQSMQLLGIECFIEVTINVVL